MFDPDKIRDSLFYLPIDGTIPKGSLSVMWIIWIVISILIMDIILTNELFSFCYKYSAGYLCGIIPVFIAFHDKHYVEIKVKKRFKHLMWGLYKGNIIMMILCLLSLSYDWNNGDTGGFYPLVRECVLLVYWFFSIPLAVIYNRKVWCLLATFTAVNSIVYMWFLQQLLAVCRRESVVYDIATIGIVSISIIISLLISYYQIRKNYKE